MKNKSNISKFLFYGSAIVIVLSIECSKLFSIADGPTASSICFALILVGMVLNGVFFAPLEKKYKENEEKNKDSIWYNRKFWYWVMFITSIVTIAYVVIMAYIKGAPPFNK